MKDTIRYTVFVTVSLALSACHVEQSQVPTTTFQSIEALYDLSFSPVERDSMEDGLMEMAEAIKSLHGYPMDNSVPPVLVFNPLPIGFSPNREQEPIDWALPSIREVIVPRNREELAFYTVEDLSVLMKGGAITSLELTQMYLKRLKRFGDTLQCVITLTEDLALSQARRADDEMARGLYRGPLHGIPYGLKDLVNVAGYKTTWGAKPYKDQQINNTGMVARKLEDEGAVLLAKLTLGALAWGDVWYGGKTRNPWNLDQGSSGSSAGSASATAAGLVAFSIGTETLGSIVSPSNRCGVTGLRPTFGRVSRSGAMALSWSMDKIGPICRSAKDCALVLEAIRGIDQDDPSTVEAAFNYHKIDNLEGLRVGYFRSLFQDEQSENSRVSLEQLRSLGADLEEVSLPRGLPGAFSIILSVEAAAAFDELTRSNKDSSMVRQIKRAWPNVFRQSRFVPAVEYLQANRVRYELIQKLHAIFKNYDVIVSPTFGGNQLTFTNLTGHPCVVVPNGFDESGSPTSITFLGNLFDEAKVVAVAELYQQVETAHKEIPPIFKP